MSSSPPRTLRNGASFDERFAALDERVTNLRSSFGHLEASTARGFAQIDTKLAELGTTITSNQRTPWTVVWAGLGVLLTFLSIVGGLVYLPVARDQVRLEANIATTQGSVADLVKALPDAFIPRRESDGLRLRAAEDRTNTLAAITDLRSEALPRNEWTLHNATVDRELDDIRRQADQIRADFGGTYSLRDALADLKQRLERVEGREPRPP